MPSGAVSVGVLIGARASIRTRFGLLCCERRAPNPPDALQAAWTGVTGINGPGGVLYWAQTGYLKRRINGRYIQARYWEICTRTHPVLTSGEYDITYGAAPAQNSVHSYACELLAPSGTALATWEFRYDGAVWGTYTHPSWSGYAYVGTRLDFCGEIHNAEDDMPGTAGLLLTCLYTDCSYKALDLATGAPNAAWSPADLVAADVRSDNPVEWGATWLNGRSFEIWDVIPGQ